MTQHQSRADKEAQLLLLPAYGRSYTTIAQMRGDWEAGRDFKIHRGPYTSIRDIAEMQRQGIAAIVLQGSYKSDAPVLRIPLGVANT